MGIRAPGMGLEGLVAGRGSNLEAILRLVGYSLLHFSFFEGKINCLLCL